LRRKNMLMRSGRIPEADALAARVGKAIINPFHTREYVCPT
jgi:hypothetical protein